MDLTTALGIVAGQGQGVEAYPVVRSGRVPNDLEQLPLGCALDGRMDERRDHAGHCDSSTKQLAADALTRIGVSSISGSRTTTIPSPRSTAPPPWPADFSPATARSTTRPASRLEARRWAPPTR